MKPGVPTTLTGAIPIRVQINERAAVPYELRFMPDLRPIHNEQGFPVGVWDSGYMTMTMKFTPEEWEKVAASVRAELEKGQKS